MFVSIHSTSEASCTAKLETTSPRKAPLKTQPKGISSSGTVLKTALRVLIKGGKKKTIVSSKAKKTQNQLVLKTVKVGKLPLKAAGKTIKKRPLPVKSEAPKNQESVANVEQNPILAMCETVTKESVAFVRETLALESEEPMDGIPVVGAENVEGETAVHAPLTPSVDPDNGDSLANVKDAVSEPAVQNIDACITEEPFRSSDPTSSEELADEKNSEAVEGTAVSGSSSSRIPSPQDQPDEDVRVGDEPSVESCCAKSPPLSQQPSEDTPGNVEGVNAEDLSSVSKFMSAEDQPESASEEVIAVPLVETQPVEPINVTACQPESDASLGKASEPVSTEHTSSEHGEIKEVKKDAEEDQEHLDDRLPRGADESCPAETAAPASERVTEQPTLSEREPKTKTGDSHEQYVAGKKTKLPGGVGKTEAVREGNGKVLGQGHCSTLELKTPIDHF